MIDQEQQRDYTEERYWRQYCPECDSSPCGNTHDGPHVDSCDCQLCIVEHNFRAAEIGLRP